MGPKVEQKGDPIHATHFSGHPYHEPEPVHHYEPEPYHPPVHHYEPEPYHHPEPVHHYEPEPYHPPVHHYEPEPYHEPEPWRVEYTYIEPEREEKKKGEYVVKQDELVQDDYLLDKTFTSNQKGKRKRKANMW